MKVVFTPTEINYLPLTEGKVYEVEIEPHEYFFAKYITTDDGEKIHYVERMFTPLNQIRQDKIDLLLK